MKFNFLNEVVLLDYLQQQNCPYEMIEHPKAKDAIEVSKLRKTPLAWGAKSLLFKDKEGFKLFTFRANRKIDNKLVRKILNSHKLRFASDEELYEITGLSKGQVPPIARPLIDVDHYIDQSIDELDRIAFTACTHTKSVILMTENYLKLIKAIKEKFCH